MEATLLGRAHAFERGDKVYIATPVVLASPTEQQVEEFAFASAVKTKAPNEYIGWLAGRYVEADRANLNGAMWLSDELAMKSLTPMLMPITVMHDPRTAVGTIADVKFLAENASTRLENILAVWRHRFPEVWEEAQVNIERGQLMQSMECWAPWYTCSKCETPFVKLAHGAERASWCDCLRSNESRRILRDTCFTGTGLIFGTRGGVGAYTEAYLDHFQDEIAEYHDRAHADSTYKPTHRSASHMGLVQIEESELAELRRERNEARSKADELQNANRELTTKVEQAEAAQKRAEEEKAAAETKATELEQKNQQTELASRRIGALGAGFLAKLGDTSKARLNELAKTCSDAQWDNELAEREELAGVKRDAAANGTTPPEGGDKGGSGSTTTSSEGSGFSSEEVASFVRGAGIVAPTGAAAPSTDGGTAVRQLARRLGKAPAGSK